MSGVLWQGENVPPLYGPENGFRITSVPPGQRPRGRAVPSWHGLAVPVGRREQRFGAANADRPPMPGIRVCASPMREIAYPIGIAASAISMKGCPLPLRVTETLP